MHDNASTTNIDPSDTAHPPILVGISSCLLGEKVRYDTGHKHSSYITGTLGQFFTFRPFCPEMAIGLGTPRETLRLVNRDGDIRCVGTKTEGHDVTERLIATGNEQASWQRELCGYILKKDSPSCGMERVKVYTKQMPEKVGVGLYAERLLANFPNLPVEEEGRLGDPVLRENFVKRVFAYREWRALEAAGVTQHRLTQFHARFKYVLLAHDEAATRELGAWLANQGSQPADTVSSEYLSAFMRILKKRATRKRHVNVLQHLQGFLKDDLDSEDKQEMVDTIEQYRQGLLPLIVPITLLRHHFRRHPKPFVDNSAYLQPHPSELMLLNNL